MAESHTPREHETKKERQPLLIHWGLIPLESQRRTEKQERAYAIGNAQLTPPFLSLSLGLLNHFLFLFWIQQSFPGMNVAHHRIMYTHTYTHIRNNKKQKKKHILMASSQSVAGTVCPTLSPQTVSFCRGCRSPTHSIPDILCLPLPFYKKCRQFLY